MDGNDLIRDDLVAATCNFFSGRLIGSLKSDLGLLDGQDSVTTIDRVLTEYSDDGHYISRHGKDYSAIVNQGNFFFYKMEERVHSGVRGK